MTRPLPHVDPMAPRSWWYRIYVRAVDTPAAAWISRTVGWKLDPVLLRWSGGRVSLGLVVPTALLETVGARTGLARSNAVIYFHDGDTPVVVASHLGASTHPAWFHNLVARPEVRFGGGRYRAEVVAADAERARLWALADRIFPPYARYRRLAADSGRSIPLVRLHPG